MAKLANDAACLATLGAVEIAPGEKPADRLIGRITDDDLEVVFAALRTTKAVSTRNHYLQTIKALEKWGRRKGYLAKPWLGEFTSLSREKHARAIAGLWPTSSARMAKSRRRARNAACWP